MKRRLLAAAAALVLAAPGDAATIILDFDEPALDGKIGSSKAFVSQGIQFRQDYGFLTPGPDREFGGRSSIAPLAGGYFTPGTVSLRIDHLEGQKPTALSVYYRPNMPTAHYETALFTLNDDAFTSGQAFDLSSIGEVRFMQFGFGIATKFGVTGTSISYVDDLVLNGVIFDPAAAVPEPASWAMMILGFGLTGAAIRTGRSRHDRKRAILTEW